MKVHYFYKIPFDLAAKYGYNLGIAFQVIDDILDVTADEKKLGKPVGSDDKNNKTTFVTIYGIEKAFAIAAQLSNAALDALDDVLRACVVFQS